MRKAGFAILILLVSAATAHSSIEDYYGETIASVKLSETAAADSFLVYNTSGLVPGEVLAAGKIQDAVKKIYALGLFSDVTILGERGDRGVNIFINVEPYPRISRIRFRGNDKLNTKKLKKQITINEGRIISPGVVKSNVELLKNLYEEKGYLNAVISTEIIPDKSDSDKAVLNFHIKEGRKIKVRRISFVGNRAFNDDKLRSKMSTKQKGFFRSGNFEREKFREDKKKIIDFYKKEGYIDAVVAADSIFYGNLDKIKLTDFSPEPGEDAADIYLKIYVDEGERYYFGKFTWEGNEIFDDNKLSSVFKFDEGDIYNQEKYDEMLFKIYEMYQDQGYWYVQIDENKAPRGNFLDVHFSISEGQPVHVRLIHIEGNTKTKEKVIRRELKIKPNTIFKRSVLGRSIRDVMVLNFFGNVTPDWHILENGDIDLILKVEEKPTGQFQIGAGYSARDKLVGTLGLGMPNFLGGGQTVTFNADFGKRRSTFSISYFEPWFRDTPTSLGLSVYYQERDWYDYYSEGRRGGSIRVGRRLNWPDNYFKVYTSYSLESLRYFDYSDAYRAANTIIHSDTTISDGDTTITADTTGYTGLLIYDWPQISSILSLTIERDSKNLAQFATAGSDIWWTGELGGTFLGGDWDYFKQTINAEYYYTPFWRFTFTLKAKWGYAFGIHEKGGVPLSSRFTPGGTDPDGVIRGYDDSRVGPASGGFLEGGRSLAVYNTELIIPLAEQQFYALLFADAGNAWRSAGELGDNFYDYKKLMKSVGFGFRVVAPMIGIIGFDFGIPLNGSKEDQGKLKPHFQIGRGF